MLGNLRGAIVRVALGWAQVKQFQGLVVVWLDRTGTEATEGSQAVPRVHDQGTRVARLQLGQPLQQARRDDAGVVVRDNHRGRAWVHLGQPVEQGLLGIRSDRAGVALVEANQDLSRDDYAVLGKSAAARLGQNVLGRHTAFLQGTAEESPLKVIANSGEVVDLSAQALDVDRGVGRTARGVGAP